MACDVATEQQIRLAAQLTSLVVGTFILLHETLTAGPVDPLLVGAGVGLITGAGVHALVQRGT
jgi:hypothetical protein